MKRGHINLTYGADINYYTDFNNRRAFGIGPSVGFRFFGFDIVNGFNFLAENNIAGNDEKSNPSPLPVNTLYMSLRYYFPVKNEFTWDRQTMKKKRARRRARMKKRNERVSQKTKNNKAKKHGN